MKVGYQTIIWGPRLRDIGGALDAIASAGFSGVEFSQRTIHLPPISDLLSMLRERGLTFLGLAGGPLWERVEYCHESRPLYLYVEDWDDDAVAATNKGFKLALHPHVYKGVHRLTDAKSLLAEHPELRWMPDVAHTAIAGDEPLEALKLASAERLVAVHIKDWTAAYGRSAHRFARGFTDLGRGELDLVSVLDELKRMRFGGWLVVEQDRPQGDPEASVSSSAEWLVKHGVALQQSPTPLVVRGRSPRPLPAIPAGIALERYIAFSDTLSGAADLKGSDCFRRISSAFAQLLPCKLVTICAWSRSSLSLLAAESDAPAILRTLRSDPVVADSLSAIAVELQDVATFDLQEDNPGAKYRRPGKQFAYPNVIEVLGLRHLLAIPLLNPHNSNHVRAVVSIFPAEGRGPLSEEELFWRGVEAAKVIDSALDEDCAYAAGKTNTLSGLAKRPKVLLGGADGKLDDGVAQVDPIRTSRGFARAVARLIREVVQCEACSIFFVNQGEDRLELAATTGMEWNVPLGQQYYLRGEGLTGQVWLRNEAVLTLNASTEKGWKGKSSERVRTSGDACLMAPLVEPDGTVVGVVRCINKKNADADTFDLFTEIELAVVDAVSQVAVPHLKVLLSKERHQKAIGRLLHEVSSPLTAIRGALKWMKFDLLRTGRSATDIFRHDYVENILSWTDLINRLLLGAQFYGLKDEPQQSERELTKLYGEVVAPAVHQITFLLLDRGFSRRSITFRDTFAGIPGLYVNKAQFQQVAFNLLSNAVKYAADDPSQFRIEIVSRHKSGHYYICFRDWGIGVQKGFDELIFEEEFRGPEAQERNVTGQGLGLWVVKRIILEHGGEVRLSRNRNPTEFTIKLPASLAQAQASVSPR